MTDTLVIYLSVGLAGCCVIALIQETVLLIQRKWKAGDNHEPLDHVHRSRVEHLQRPGR